MHQRILTFASIFLLASGLSLGGAHALQAADPAAAVNELVKQAIGDIKSTQGSDVEREAEFRKLLEAGFDIPRISRFVLGRYWNGADEASRRTFADLFENWIVRTYGTRFREYGGQTIQVTSTRTESETTTVVMSQFVNPNAKAPPAKVEWHVRKMGENDYKIIDVSVEGVSMALTQRDEIAAVADRNGGTIDGLNKALQQRLANGEAPPAQ
jgi:phospholipid transport system substrate-binding protein